MFGLDTVIALIASHGLWLVGGLALIEGPIVSVLSTWLAANGMFDLWPLGAVLLAGDLAFGIGRDQFEEAPQSRNRGGYET